MSLQSPATSSPQGFYWVHKAREPETGTGREAERGASPVISVHQTFHSPYQHIFPEIYQQPTEGWGNVAEWKAENWARKHREVSVSHRCSDTELCWRNETSGELELVKAATKSRIISTTDQFHVVSSPPHPMTKKSGTCSFLGINLFIYFSLFFFPYIHNVQDILKYYAAPERARKCNP